MSDVTVARSSLSRRISQRLAELHVGLLVTALVVIALLTWVAALQFPDGRLHVAFLDVGQGDAILITTPEGRQILVDGGPNPTQLAWALGRHMPFWDRSLDLIVLTHPDSDHMTGLIPLFKRYQVKRALASSLVIDGDEAGPWRQAAKAADVGITVAERGMIIDPGSGVHLEVLHPSAAPLSRGASDNDSSIVLRLTYGATSFLFTGDLEAPGEQELLDSGPPLAAQVLKVSHHGSSGATTARFLRAVMPQLAVIQVGADNLFGHPAPELLARLEEAAVAVLRTDRQGTIVISSDGQQLRVRTTRRVHRDE
jgi:competence protein ComEC